MKSMTMTIAIAVSCFAGSAMAEALGEHPAVLVKRQAAHGSPQADYLKFYLHPAGLQLWARAPDAGMPEQPTKLAARPHSQVAN